MRESNVTGPLRIVQPECPSDAADDSMAIEGHKPLVPDGEYLARYLGHDTAILFVRAQKVTLEFEICEGPHAGVRLTRYFRVKQIIGRPGRGGRFKLAAGGDLYRTLARVLDVRTRPARISLRPLRQMLFKIGVRTVERDRDNLPLAEGVRYSVIQTIDDGR